MTPATPPVTPQVEEKLHKFPCRQCGADLKFHAGAHSLRCEYCGHTEQIPHSKEAIVEYAYSETLAPSLQKGWGTERKSFKCENCGATSSLDPGVVSSHCDFCGSPKVIEASESADVIRPESLLPFIVDRNGARGAFSKWIKSLWFRPSNLARESTLGALAGMYIPYWTFDTCANSFWQAEAGHYYYTTESYTQGGVRKTRQVRHVRWVPAEGTHDAFYDDELVCASRGLPQRYVKSIDNFNTKNLQPYDARFLSGWKAELYSVDLKEGWQRARAAIAEKIRQACAALVPGDTHRNLRVQTAYSGITYKHVLLPIWVTAFQYGQKSYQVVINGQTGAVSGSAPYSIAKILGALAAVALAVLIIGYFS